MKLLSFDTSTSDLHLCLADDRQIIAERIIKSRLENKQTRQYAASALIPSIQELLDEIGWDKLDLEALAVGIGPGSFTGIRIATVTARSIAQALGLPLIGISILESYVFCHGESAGVVLSAGKEKYFGGAYNFVPAKLDLVSNDLKNAIAPIFADKEGILSLLGDSTSWLADSESLLWLKEYATALQVPTLNNIAVVQAKLAFNKLSLSKAEAKVGASGESLAKYLLAAFPYERVMPLYLQGPSVTLKFKA